jgi:ubiquinol-cytochrome c reductase cytochrome c1 subunit
MRKLLIAAAALFALSAPALAAEGAPKPPSNDWSFKGPFGTYNRGELQRGFVVYKEVCAACHSLRYVSYRNLADIGFSEAEVKAIAAAVEVTAGPNDDGEMFERPALPSDRFKSPFANAKAAAAANNGVAPPDLSLMAKARIGGPDYVKGLLLGYEKAPAGFTVPDGGNYNKYFPGHVIAMAQPLASEGQVTYDDGTKATIEQMAHDVSAFLMWTAEPKLEARYATGFKVIVFLLILSGLLYAAKRRVWADVH